MVLDDKTSVERVPMDSVGEEKGFIGEEYFQKRRRAVLYKLLSGRKQDEVLEDTPKTATPVEPWTYNCYRQRSTWC